MTNDVCAEPPVVELAIEAKDRADDDRLIDAIEQLVARDPTLRVSRDAATGQIVLGGAGERHLDVALTMLMDGGIALHIGAPQVAYLETVTHPAEIDHTHKRIVDGVAEFARVKLHIGPVDAGRRDRFSSRIAAGDLPADFVSAVEDGVGSALAAGVVAGFRVVDVAVVLRDAAFHDTDSTPRAFEAAARTACREALIRAGACLLEPIMAVDVTTPAEKVEAVVDDLRLRRSEIRGRSPSGDAIVVSAFTPFANLFGYENTLRSIARGRASFSARFARYERVPPRHDDDPPTAPALALRP